jgi:hypothetical protein
MSRIAHYPFILPHVSVGVKRISMNEQVHRYLRACRAAALRNHLRQQSRRQAAEPRQSSVHAAHVRRDMALPVHHRDISWAALTETLMADHLPYDRLFQEVIGGYPARAVVSYQGVLWQSQLDDNMTRPGECISAWRRMDAE